MISPPETHIIRVSGSIRRQPALISAADVQAALAGWRPVGKGLDVQLRARSGWGEVRRQLDDAVDGFLAQTVFSSLVKHLSVFAIAPIPLLMALGRRLGEATTAVVYNHHRDPVGWTWGEAAPEGSRLRVECPRRSSANTVAVLFSVSGPVTPEAVEDALSLHGCAVYELMADEPRPNLLRTQNQLARFRDHWRRVLAHIHAHHPGRPIHLFGALPPAAAVAVGQCLMPDLTATVHAYQWEKSGYTYALTLQGEPLITVDLARASALLLEMFSGTELKQLIEALPYGSKILRGMPIRHSPEEISRKLIRVVGATPAGRAAFVEALHRERSGQEDKVSQLLALLSADIL